MTLPRREAPLESTYSDESGEATTTTRSPDFASETVPRQPGRALTLAPGHKIGQYELIRLLGRGGMGQVHLARDLRLGRLVALKLMNAQHPGRIRRFLAEARATARCHHENIVVIHEVDEHDGQPYMVLEYLEGQTLRQWRREHATASGQRAPVPPGRAVELMLPVVRALVYAHEHGIVHRDLKPENILLTRTGTVKVLDFGLAKLLSAPDEGTDGSAVTVEVRSSALAGTLPYMSPEQMRVGAIDHRSDLWAVGIILFELVTGAHPVPSRAMRDFLRIADPDVAMPCVRERMPEIGPLAAVIDRCLLKDREHRTASARELLAELEVLLPDRRAAPVGEAGSPFAGLAAFQEADASRFFGRDRDVAQIVTELRSRPLVTLVGPSGTGKSSLVRAGVIPALKRSGEGWDAHIVRPGRAPLAALAGLLGPGHGLSESIERLRAEPGHLGVRLRTRATCNLRRILIFVDQLEELYTLGAPPDERAAFLAVLAAVADDATSPLRVILSMRSDFLDRLAEHRGLGAELARGLVLVPPMGREGMREALLRPLEASEYRFESPALVDRMLDALAATPGALPLLQFTAARLWELRDTGRRLLTEASYAQLGGVAGALATHADAVLAGMPSAQQAVARAVLERLVTPERTRALVSLAELHAVHGDTGAVHDVIQHLAALRLLVIARGAEGADHAVELVHESLIDRWPTLARWLTENQDDAAFLARLRSAAQEWEKRGRDAGLLWRDAPAREARLWHGHYRRDLPARERAYLDAVFALVDRDARARRRIVAGIMALMALLLVGASVALFQIRLAQHQATEQAGLARMHAGTVQEQIVELSDKEVELRSLLASEQQLRSRAEQAQRDAEQARKRAQTEAERAHDTLAQSRRAEARARQAEIEAHELRRKAEAAAAKERQARKELEQLVIRSHGPLRDTLR